MEYDGAPVSVVLLGEPDGTPSPDRDDCCHFWAGCIAPHPPDTPPYGLLPNMSESSGTPGENSPGFSRLVLRGEPPKVDCNVMGQEPTFA